MKTMMLFLLLLVPFKIHAKANFEKVDILLEAVLHDPYVQYHNYKILHYNKKWALVQCVMKSNPRVHEGPPEIFTKNMEGRWVDTGLSANVCCESDFYDHKWLIGNGYKVPRYVIAWW